MSIEECFRCRAQVLPEAARYHLRIGMDLTPVFDAPAPEQSTTAEEETLFLFCARCQPEVATRVDELLSWLWAERPPDPEGFPTPLASEGVGDPGLGARGSGPGPEGPEGRA